jgi:hypothetical protein
LTLDDIFDHYIVRVDDFINQISVDEVNHLKTGPYRKKKFAKVLESNKAQFIWLYGKDGPCIVFNLFVNDLNRGGTIAPVFNTASFYMKAVEVGPEQALLWKLSNDA